MFIWMLHLENSPDTIFPGIKKWQMLKLKYNLTIFPLLFFHFTDFHTIDFLQTFLQNFHLWWQSVFLLCLPNKHIRINMTEPQ